MPRTDYSGTLAELRRAVPWFVIWCEGRLPSGYQCMHSGASAVVPHMIASEGMRRYPECSPPSTVRKCGHKGASVMHPSYGRHPRDAPFPEFPRGRQNA
jgi:hypothetical protein